MDILRERARRPFVSIEDLKLRVPFIQKSELAALAAIGALNFIGADRKTHGRGIHRRDALWQIERASRRPGPLLERSAPEDSALEDFALEQSGLDNIEIDPREESGDRAGTAPQSMGSMRNRNSPLQPMTAEERLVADFRGTGMTVGPHPMAYHRASLKKQGIRSAAELHDDSRWNMGARRRIGDRAAASGHGEGIRVSQPGRRNGNFERDHYAATFRTGSRGGSAQAISAD